MRVSLVHARRIEQRENMKDALSKLLGNWEPSIPEPADFRENVWRRIEVAEPSRRSLFRSCYERVLILFSVPRMAVAMAILAVFAGIAVGSSAAHSDNATAYLRSVNPYAQLSGLR